MRHPDLAEMLSRRLAIIADHEWRDRDPAAQLEALKQVSADINSWHAAHRGTLPARLEHFLQGASYSKALDFLQSDAPPIP